MNTLLATTDNKIWDIPAIHPKDDTIEKFDYVSVYDDNHGSGTLANANSFSFTTNNEDVWFVPNQSYLLMKIKLRQLNDAEYRWASAAAVGDRAAVEADNININDNIANIFEEARYYIDDKEVERIDYVGIATLINNLINVTDVKKLASMKHSEMFFLNEHDKRQTYVRACAGTINVLIPLENIFPFCKYIDHAFRGVKHRITFRLNDSNQLVHRGAIGIAEGKVYIENMEWKIPQAEPSLELMTKLEGMLAKDSMFHLTWPAINVYRIQPPKTTEIRTMLSSTIHKPTNIFIACQSLNRSSTQLHRSMVFDKNNVTEVQVEVNSVRFPDRPLKVDYTAKSGAIESYNRFLDICKNGQACIDYETFRDVYPLYHIDLSKHKAELYENTNFPNIVVNMKFSQVPAQDYILWVIIYNEREGILNLDHKKMRVIR